MLNIFKRFLLFILHTILFQVWSAQHLVVTTMLKVEPDNTVNSLDQYRVESIVSVHEEAALQDALPVAAASRPAPSEDDSDDDIGAVCDPAPFESVVGMGCAGSGAPDSSQRGEHAAARNSSPPELKQDNWLEEILGELIEDDEDAEFLRAEQITSAVDEAIEDLVARDAAACMAGAPASSASLPASSSSAPASSSTSPASYSAHPASSSPSPAPAAEADIAKKMLFDNPSHLRSFASLVAGLDLQLDRLGAHVLHFSEALDSKTSVVQILAVARQVGGSTLKATCRRHKECVLWKYIR